MINTKDGKTTQVTILSCRLPSRMDNPLAATYLNIHTNQTQVYLVPVTGTKFIENPFWDSHFIQSVCASVPKCDTGFADKGTVDKFRLDFYLVCLNFSFCC